MFHERFEHQNGANSMEHEKFELKNVANTVEMAPSSSKMLQIAEHEQKQEKKTKRKKTNKQKKHSFPNNSGPTTNFE